MVELVDTDADESTESEAGLREHLATSSTCRRASEGALARAPRRRPVGRGSGSEDKGLWGTVVLWQQFLEQRASVVGSKMQRRSRRRSSYLKNNEIDSGKVNSRGEMRMEDLPADLRQEIQTIQRRYREELEAMEADPYGLQFQALLQTNSHVERLAVFRHILDTERKRLAARQTLQSMFKVD